MSLCVCCCTVITLPAGHTSKYWTFRIIQKTPFLILRPTNNFKHVTFLHQDPHDNVICNSFLFLPFNLGCLSGLLIFGSMHSNIARLHSTRLFRKAKFKPGWLGLMTHSIKLNIFKSVWKDVIKTLLFFKHFCEKELRRCESENRDNKNRIRKYLLELY